MINTYESRGWIKDSCGCCNGIKWGGETPETCDICGGAGVYWVSPKGRIADYPGGPFRGQLSVFEHKAFRTRLALEDQLRINSWINKKQDEPRQRDVRRITLEYGRDSRGVSGVLDARIEYK